MSERQSVAAASIIRAASDDDEAEDDDDVAANRHCRRRCCPSLLQLSQLPANGLQVLSLKKQRAYRKRCSSAGCCNNNNNNNNNNGAVVRFPRQDNGQHQHHNRRQQKHHQQGLLVARGAGVGVGGGGGGRPGGVGPGGGVGGGGQQQLTDNNSSSSNRIHSPATADPHLPCRHLSAAAITKELVNISPTIKSEDMTESQPQKKRRISMCVGCGAQIHDQYILHVAPDLEWHAACLKCADCHQFLDETCTCFVRDGKTYCKRDYVRLFGTKCSKCKLGFSKNDFVMRARNKIYHIDCFRCMSCSRQLRPGDEFALKEDSLFCKADHEVLETGSPTGDQNKPATNNNNNNQNGHLSQNGLQLAASAEPALMSGGRQRDSVRPQVHKNSGGSGDSSVQQQQQQQQQKTTRVRTVLNEKQLHTLRTCYAANPRPDALMKEQLVEMTALSPRVIRVWFQNKRCKDKKRSILMKQMQQQEKDGRRLPALAGMHGVPMIASSPVRHESPLHVINAAAVEVHSYQPPWKALSEFAMQAAAAAGGELDRLDPSQPPFQQLVSQMHGYTDTGDGLTSLSGQPQLTYLGNDDSLQQPPSNMSSQIPGTPSELSSPGSD